MFTKVVVSDAGCFWQENTMLGTFGAGMGISTWWYRGSDMDTERSLEQKAGRTLTELSIDGNKGFKAYDANACSIYVAKGGRRHHLVDPDDEPGDAARSVHDHRPARRAQSRARQLTLAETRGVSFAQTRSRGPTDDAKDEPSHGSSTGGDVRPG